MKWIDVNDQLPEYEDPVLILILGDTTQHPVPRRIEFGMRIGTNKRGEQWQTHSDRGNLGSIPVAITVTHWMPVPDLPDLPDYEQ